MLLLFRPDTKDNKKKRYGRWLLIALAAFFLNISAPVCAAGYEDMPPLELYQRMADNADNGYLILDIRDAADYEKGHIPEAVNIPLKELGYRLYTLDRTKDIIVYCDVGLQSKIACQVLTNAGFKDVYNLTGGLKAWDYALETDYGGVGI